MKLSATNLSRSSLAALAEASAAINSSLDPPVVLSAIARSAAEVLQAEASSVLLLDRRRKKMIFAAAVGDRGDDLLGEEFDAGLGIAGHVVDTGKPVLIGDVRQDDHFYDGIDDMSTFHTRGLIAAPMIHKSEVIGVIEVLNRKEPGSFGESDIELLTVFANLAAMSATNAHAHATLQRDNRGLRETVLGLDRIIGASGPLEHMLKLCDRVAGSNATVLLLGETGTGKEVAARYIYQQSQRRDRSFVGLNCAALSETLLESELFGHEKGAFTGATMQKIGRFELADGGTLFLDEIGDISPAMQVKLLRVLEEREFVRVGGIKTVACDARIIAATNRDLKTAVAEGSFREDLYYRLNVFPIEIPPLRERREDIATLVDHFVKQAGIDLGVPTPGIASETVAIMTGHAWPGNIRELKNVVERAVLMCDGDTILPAHLPLEIAGAAAETSEARGDSSLWGYERAMIQKALTDAKWNQSAAARALGISRDNLRYRIKKYDIQTPQ